MRVRWSPEAADNLDEIHHYLSLDDSPLRASTVATIYDGVRSLADFPHRGRSGRIEGTRELLFSKLPFIVVYRIRNDAVHVVSVRHAARTPLE